MVIRSGEMIRRAPIPSATLVLILGFVLRTPLLSQSEPECPGCSSLPRSLLDELPTEPDPIEAPLTVPDFDPDVREPASEQAATPPRDKQESSSAPRVFPPPHDSIGDFAETHFSSLAWKAFVWEDYLLSSEVLIPVGLGLGAVVIHHWDKQLLRQWGGALGGHQTYSNIGLYVSIGAAVGTGLVFPGEGRNWWDNAWSMGESYGVNALTVYVLKSTVQRPRPGSTPGTGIGIHSFPSGHAASAFASATLIQRNSGWLAGAPAYGLAAFTAFERVESHRHYPSDVFAGAAIGTLSSGIMDSLHWGSGPGRGIAGARGDVRVSFEERPRGFDLEVCVRF